LKIDFSFIKTTKKMKKFTCLAMLIIVLKLTAQDVSMDLQKPSAMSAVEKVAAWRALAQPVGAAFGSSNMRYAYDLPVVAHRKQRDTLVAWRGERVHTQLVLWSSDQDQQFDVKVGTLNSSLFRRITARNISVGWVGYTMTDEFAGGCGYRKPENFDSSMVADIIYTKNHGGIVKRQTTQPVWISVDIPAAAKAGDYTAIVKVKADKVYELPLVIRVQDRVLPPPAEWSHALDLWQHPAAVARVHDVELWSKEHFSLMKPYYTMLAAAGQKSITASIVDEPWGHQTYDDFPSLIEWTKKADGSWSFDYSLFDRYIDFVMSCGITERINCYSMVPWKIAFPYFDESTGTTQLFTGNIGTPEYNAFWTPMLTDFARHLKSKGWFEITTIAMDERPMAAMQAVIKLLKEIDPEWKIALAGDYHSEIEDDIYDYCVASRFKFPQDVLEKRQAAGKLSTWYTCCTEKYPNGFTFSPPAEHVWLGWYTAAHGMDGYLRWAYNSWPVDPINDSRFTAWPAGDTFQVYPGPYTSIRFEKLIEGIQDFEKIRILKEEALRNNDSVVLATINKVLSVFEIKSLAKETAEQQVTTAKQLLFEH
jgi:hypothetical protein